MFKKELVSISERPTVNFIVYSLYEKYKDIVKKIFEYLSDDDIYSICSHFIKNNDEKIGFEIFTFIKDKNSQIINLLHDSDNMTLFIENSLFDILLEEIEKGILATNELVAVSSSFAKCMVDIGDIEDAKPQFKVAIMGTLEIDDRDCFEALLGIVSDLTKSGIMVDKAKLYNDLVGDAKKIDNKMDKFPFLFVIASSLCHIGKIDEATALFEEAISIARKENYGKGNSEILSVIASSLCHIGKIDEATALFEEAIEIAKKINNTDDEKLLILIRISRDLAQTDQIEDHTSLFKKIIDVEIFGNSNKLFFLSSIASILAQFDKIDEATALFEEFIRYDKNLDVDDYDEEEFNALSSMVKSLCQIGKVDESAKIAEKIGINKEKYRALSFIFISLAKSGKLEEATVLFEAALRADNIIDNYSSRVDALFAIASDLVKSGKLEEATTLFQAALRNARMLNIKQKKSEAMINIVESLAQIGKIKETIPYIKEMESKDSSTALRSIINSLADSGKVDEAFPLFEEIITIVRNLDDPEDKAKTLSTIASTLADSGKVDKAFPLFEESVRILRDVKIDDSFGVRLHILSSIVRTLSKADTLLDTIILFEDTIRTIREIDDPKDKTNTLSTIASTLADSGKVDEAFPLFEESVRIAKEIHDPEDKANTLSTIASTLADSGKVDEAFPLFEESVRIAKEIHDPQHRYHKMSTIASTVTKFDNLLNTTRLINDIINIVKEVEDLSGRCYILSDIASALIVADKANDALKLFNYIINIAKKMDGIDNYGKDKSVIISKVIYCIDELLKTVNTESLDKLYNIDRNDLPNEETDAGSYKKKNKSSSTIAFMLAKSEIMKELTNLLKDGLKIIRQMDNDESKSEILNVFTFMLIRMDKPKYTLALIEELVETTKELKDSKMQYSKRASILAFIARYLALLGEVDKAIEIGRGLENNYDRFYALSEVIDLLGFKGIQSEELERVITSDLEKVPFPLNNKNILWNYIIKQSIGYSGVAYSVCYLMMKLYPDYSMEISNLMFKYT